MLRPGARLALVLAALAACGEHRAAPPPAVADAAPPSVPPVATQIPLPRVAGANRPRLHLTLRSTPAGAAATIDGRLVGMTPVRWELDDDGRVHDFSFVLKGYEPWRLRFSPSHDGVVHAQLRAVLYDDAGVQGSTQ